MNEVIKKKKKAKVINIPGLKSKRTNIEKRPLSRPKEGKPLKSMYDIIDPKTFSKWVQLNYTNQLAVDMVKMYRTDLLGSRDAWHPREFHTAQAINAHHNPISDGADAYFSDGTPIEIKSNWTNSVDKRLYGTGVFNDYSQERFDRLYKENYVLVSTLYVKHKLLAVIRLPLHWDPLKAHLQSQLSNVNGGRVSLNFSASNWMGCPDIEFFIKPSLVDLFKYQQYFGSSLFEYMINYLDEDIKGLVSKDIV